MPNGTYERIKKNYDTLPLKPLQWHWGVGPSVKHVLGVQGWSYTVPEKPFFNKRVWFSPLFEEKKYQKSFRKTKSDPPTFSDF